MIERWIFNETIRDAGVELVLQGHEHGYTHCTADEEPLKGNECRNPPLYTVSHCSPKNYNLKPAKRFHPVLNGRFYQIVRVQKDAITMLGYNADTGACIDSVSIFQAPSTCHRSLRISARSKHATVPCISPQGPNMPPFLAYLRKAQTKQQKYYDIYRKSH